MAESPLFWLPQLMHVQSPPAAPFFLQPESRRTIQGYRTSIGTLRKAAAPSAAQWRRRAAPAEDVARAAPTHSKRITVADNLSGVLLFSLL